MEQEVHLAEVHLAEAHLVEDHLVEVHLIPQQVPIQALCIILQAERNTT